MRLKDKTAIITGGAGGIGSATVRRFAREGASVVVVDIAEEAGENLVRSIVDDGGTADFFRADLNNPSEIAAMVAHACSRYGRLDILHNNAIAATSGHVGEIDRADWDLVVHIGLTAYWLAIKEALAPMVEQGSGSIVNTASTAGLAGDYTFGVYGAVKAGVINLTRVTAIEYARKGIRCNSVCPAVIGTPAMLAMREAIPQVIDPVLESNPMGRFGKPEEIAATVLFLASDEASFITGAVFPVDGGQYAHTRQPTFGGPEWDGGP
jgi:meso-butanediol dehydrogenase/(S,S)-butanediol dehydrogenase/diacetyl reductase